MATTARTFPAYRFKSVEELAVAVQALADEFVEVLWGQQYEATWIGDEQIWTKSLRPDAHDGGDDAR